MVTVNDKVKFRTEPSQRRYKCDDSVLKTWSKNDQGEEYVEYGIIKQIFTHSMFPDGPKDVFAECDWLINVPDDGVSWLPQVRKDPMRLSNANQRQRVILLRQCASYNIMVAPHDPWDANCDVFDVLDRHRTYEDHSFQEEEKNEEEGEWAQKHLFYICFTLKKTSVHLFYICFTLKKQV